MALQTVFNQHPDSALKDIAISGLTGGSSSRFAKVDSSEIYVPLKKRVGSQNR